MSNVRHHEAFNKRRQIARNIVGALVGRIRIAVNAVTFSSPRMRAAMGLTVATGS